MLHGTPWKERPAPIVPIALGRVVNVEDVIDLEECGKVSSSQRASVSGEKVNANANVCIMHPITDMKMPPGFRLITEPMLMQRMEKKILPCLQQLLRNMPKWQTSKC
jgi:hypothetical protein